MPYSKVVSTFTVSRFRRITYQLQLLAEPKVAKGETLGVSDIFSLLLLVDVGLLSGRRHENLLFFLWFLDCLHDLKLII